VNNISRPSVGLVNPILVGCPPVSVMAVPVVGICLAGVVPAMRGRMVSAAIVRATGRRGQCGIVMRAAWSLRVGPVRRSKSGRQGKQGIKQCNRQTQ